MKHKPTIEELEDETRFEKVSTLQYGDIGSFVISRFPVTDIPMLSLWLSLLISVFLTVWFWPGLRYHIDEPHIVRGLITGLIIIPVLIIPVHEGLHLIPFYLAGARKIKIGADMSQGIVFVTAHRFVTDGWLFSFVAVIPFILLTAVAIISIPLLPSWWQWVVSLSLAVHITMCAGDAAMISFTRSLGIKNLYTWDDADSREAYFFIAKNISTNSKAQTLPQ